MFKRKRAEAGHKRPKENHEAGPCLNCGTQLRAEDLFCSNCGQKRMEREDMSFRHLIGESFLDYFHFDSKFFRTIIPLIIRPGMLTSEYMKGKRKSYVEPFKLFLVISVIYFLLLPFSGRTREPENAGRIALTDTITKRITGKIKARNSVSFSLHGVTLGKRGIDSVKKQIDTIGLDGYVAKNFAKESVWTRIFVKQALKIMIGTGESFVTVLEHTASKLIFLFIPVFAALLKLLYIRKKRLYFEHLIFSLHLHAFIFLIFILNLLTGLVWHVNMFIILLIILIYGFIALKKYYGQTFGKTLMKMVLISASYLVIGVPLFFMLLLLIAVISF